MSTAARSRARHWGRWTIAALLCAAAAYVALLYILIDRQSRRDETRAADAIVVFGAAEYAGHPSPVYKARLDHAYELFERHIAPVVITTGGAGGDMRFTEGMVGHDYLMRRGIPDQDLIAETQAEDTEESASRVAEIMRVNGMKSCVAVSDDYHMFRVKRLLRRNGVTVYAAPRPDYRPVGRWEHTVEVLREVLSYTLFRMHIT